MNVHVVTQISINASPEAVFKYLAHLKYHYLWNPQVMEFSPVIKLKKGTEYSTASYVLGKQLTAKNRVTKLIRNKELHLENSTGSIQYKAGFLLESQGDKTIVSCETTVSLANRAFGFGKPVLEILAKRELQTDLRALKIAVEQDLE